MYGGQYVLHNNLFKNENTFNNKLTQRIIPHVGGGVEFKQDQRSIKVIIVIPDYYKGGTIVILSQLLEGIVSCC